MIDQEIEGKADSISDPYLREPDSDHAAVGRRSPERLRPPDPAGTSSGRKATISRPNHPRQKGKITAENVMNAFNTWAFKREQPDNPQLMLQTIARAIALGEPIPFVLYWGKGPRDTIATPDIECLEYIASLTRRVGDVYPPGAAIKLIFTDTHAELNGHSQPGSCAYFHEIDALAHAFGFDHCWMSHLTRAAEGLLANDLLDDLGPDDDILKPLATSAAKWYRGEETPERAARIYYKLNMVEKQAVEIAFPHSIFITFNGSRLRRLFPKHMPVFYMYSLHRGISIKPWFFPTNSSR